jgi:hypothetical protein
MFSILKEYMKAINEQNMISAGIEYAETNISNSGYFNVEASIVKINKNIGQIRTKRKIAHNSLFI